jgi:hypothetical protein
VTRVGRIVAGRNASTGLRSPIPVPAITSRRSFLLAPCGRSSAYDPNVSISGSNLGKGFPPFRAQNSFRRSLLCSLGSISLWGLA